MKAKIGVVWTDVWMPREYLNKLGRLFENPGWERGGSLGRGRGCAVITKSRSDVRLLGGRSTAYQHVKSKGRETCEAAEPREFNLGPRTSRGGSLLEQHLRG